MDFSEILEELSKVVAEKAPMDFDNLLAESVYQSQTDKNMSDTIIHANNEEFIGKCYSLLLDRPADAAGVQAWTAQLNNGKSREAVVESFKGSAEYIAKNSGIFDSNLDLPKESDLTGIYIDISNFVTTKALTGIQRVVVEVCTRLLADEKYRFLVFNKRIDKFLILDRKSVLSFFQNPQNSMPEPVSEADVGSFGAHCTYFDMDSAWNTPHKRSYIYKEFSSKDVKIVSYIYDLIPIVEPKALTGSTLKNFTIYIAAVLKYANLIITDSLSTENDLFRVRDRIGCEKTPSLVTGLGVKPYVATDYEPEITLEIPTHKYILFVGTLEPRKRQNLVLDAFLEVQKSNKNVSLVFIGKMGWGGDGLSKKIEENLDNNVRWYSHINDETLRRLYTNAFLNIYISNYEGYGLPVAEGLAAGQVTLTSLNSSIYEAGQNFADYIQFNTVGEIVKYMEVYLANTELYNAKKNYIKTTYNPPSWDVVSRRIDNAIVGLSNREVLAENLKIDKIQHVSISIRPDTFAKNIQLQQKYGCCASEFVVITRAELMDDFRNIKSRIPLKIIDESVIISNNKDVEFDKLDHLQKNWLLRTGIADLDEINDVFVMLDDDNFPMSEGNIDRFVDRSGRYKAYYFHNMLTWNHHGSSFDRGMQRARTNAMAFGTEFRAYASHCSQIINKTLFKEAIGFASTPGMAQCPSEWETYFNYAITHHPHMFLKSKACVMNWPAQPSDWPAENQAGEFLTENYHEYLYEAGHVFEGIDIEDQEEKIRRKKELLLNYQQTIDENTKLKSTIGALDLFHTLCRFEHANGMQIFLSNLPKYIKIKEKTVAHVDVNYKILNSGKQFKGSSLQICFRQLDAGNDIFLFDLNLESAQDHYQEAIFKLPVIPSNKVGGEFYELVVIADSKEFVSIDGACKIFVEGI